MPCSIARPAFFRRASRYLLAHPNVLRANRYSYELSGFHFLKYALENQYQPFVKLNERAKVKKVIDYQSYKTTQKLNFQYNIILLLLFQYSD